MSMCPYLEYDKKEENKPAVSCRCRLSGCRMSVGNLMVKFICSNQFDEFRSCYNYKVRKEAEQGK